LQGQICEDHSTVFDTVAFCCHDIGEARLADRSVEDLSVKAHKLEVEKDKIENIRRINVTL
jgi:hypothetical protein